MNEIRSRLHIPHPYIPEGITCNCDKDLIVDQHGLHLQMCPTENQRLQIHNFIVAELKEMSQQADLTAQPNNVRVSPDPSDGRRGDLHIIVSGHKHIVVDVQVTNACSVQGNRPGTAAKQSEQKKNNRYAKSVRELGADFYAFGIEVQGRFGTQAQQLFNYLANKLSLATGAKTHVVRSYWARRISCTLRNKIAEAQRFKADRIMTCTHSTAQHRADIMHTQTSSIGRGRLGDTPTTHWDVEILDLEDD